MKNNSIVPRFPKLKRNQQRGSKPRCHLLTGGTKEEVAARLSTLIVDHGEVPCSASWMPKGFDDCDEAQLHTAEKIIPKPQIREHLLQWWLAVPGARSTTPNWDIASTCLVHGKPGVLLVEAKAHTGELRNEEHGKKLENTASSNSRRNHIHIGACSEEANVALSDQTKLEWALSRDRNYQMSNRFTWAWKLVELQIPVILIYLGFLNCSDMAAPDGKENGLILNNDQWLELVESHSSPLFPRDVWNRNWQIHAQTFVPLIRTYAQIL